MKFLELQFCIFVVLPFLCQWNIWVFTFFAWKITRPTNQVRLSWKVATDSLATPPAESGWNGEEIVIHTYSAVGWTPNSCHQKMAPQDPTSEKLSAGRPKNFHKKEWKKCWKIQRKQTMLFVWIQITAWVHQKKSIHPNWDPKKTGMPNIYSLWRGVTLHQSNPPWTRKNTNDMPFKSGASGVRTSLAHFNDRNFKSFLG